MLLTPTFCLTSLVLDWQEEERRSNGDWRWGWQLQFSVNFLIISCPLWRLVVSAAVAESGLKHGQLILWPECLSSADFIMITPYLDWSLCWHPGPRWCFLVTPRHTPPLCHECHDALLLCDVWILTLAGRKAVIRLSQDWAGRGRHPPPLHSASLGAGGANISRFLLSTIREDNSSWLRNLLFPALHHIFISNPSCFITINVRDQCMSQYHMTYRQTNNVRGGSQHNKSACIFARKYIFLLV